MKFAHQIVPIFNLLVVTALIVGCTDSGSTTPPVTTEMTEDFDHNHSHQHSDHADHEHHHDDEFNGTHAHGHSHDHRHGKPLHGGRIVSIGHTHHGEGAAHFHAEVMPIEGDTIRFHLLTESEQGESIDLAIKDLKIPGIISIRSAESISVDCVFKAVGDGEEASEFALEVPERLAKGETFSVVIPKLTVGGHRQNFSFTATRTGHSHDDDHEHGDHAHDADDHGHDKDADYASDSDEADTAKDDSAESAESDPANDADAAPQESGDE